MLDKQFIMSEQFWACFDILSGYYENYTYLGTENACMLMHFQWPELYN